MLKMIMTLPAHIKAEEFISVTMDVIKGRYGQFSYYGDVKPQISPIFRVSELPSIFSKGFSGKKCVNFYEIDARELDPVIIATIEEVGEWVGLKYGFTTEFEIISRDWWRPYGNFQNAPVYGESSTIDYLRDAYDEALVVINN